MKLKCIRRVYDSDKVLIKIEQEYHDVTIIYHEGNLNSWWIKLSPGVTGYESAQISNLLKSESKGWFANAGSYNYPELYVLPDEMNRLREYLNLIKDVLKLVKPDENL